MKKLSSIASLLFFASIVSAQQKIDGDGIQDGAVVNEKLADMAAWSIKARNGSTAGDPQDITASEITEVVAPAPGVVLIGFNTLDEFIKVDIGNLPSSSISHDMLTNVLPNQHHAPTVDTVLDQVGVEALGFTQGPHTVDTNTQLSDSEVASAAVSEGFVVGPHFSGAYGDLTGLPSIPVNTSDVVNNSGFITNQVTGNINVTGTVDGVDISADSNSQAAHLADSTVHFQQSAITIQESQVTNLSHTVDTSAATLCTSGQILAGGSDGCITTPSGSAGVPDGDKGDITVSSSGSVWAFDYDNFAPSGFSVSASSFNMVLSDPRPSFFDQFLAFPLATQFTAGIMSASDKATVDAALTSEVDGSTTNEIQTLSILGSDLTLSDGGGTITLPSGGGGGIGNVVEDTAPQLGGNLDLNGFGITGQTYMVPIIAEESVDLSAGSYQWSFGNGLQNIASGGIGIYVPSGWEAHVVAMTLRTTTLQTATVELVLGGVDQGALADVSIAGERGATNDSFSPVAVTNNDNISFKTTSVGGVFRPGVVTAWVRYTKL